MNNPQSPVSDGMKIGIAIGSFFVPLLGLIMGLIYINDSHPDKKAAGKLWLIVSGSVIGLNLVCCCAYAILIGAAGAGGNL
jgi:tetrahydromethanopterin S-methyltransferase subunit G